jgi:putative CocE/NonD family hydrolase
VPAADGARLMTDVFEPEGLARAPTVLIRSPYGRRHFGLFLGGPFATQGYVVVVQSCRGTAGSDGEFDPHHDELRDGLATLDWIERQPFFDGQVVTYGPSYLGYTQWAIAAAAGPELKAMAMQVTLSDFSRMTYAGGSLMLRNALSWTQMVTRMKTALGKLRLALGMLLRREGISAEQWRSLPLVSLDEEVTGERVPFWRDWMEHASYEDPWWAPMDFHRTIDEVRRPITLVAGWHDIFAPWTLRDFEALQRAGAPACITVGPWRHTDAEVGKTGLRDALDFFSAHTGGPPSARSEPVRLYLKGADEWCDFDQWPPKESVVTPCYLQPEAGLAGHPAPVSPPARYRYDPGDPTPSLGGPALATTPFAVDNAALEARGDVLCFTSALLAADLDVIGAPSAELHVESSAESADFFVRLCDVDEKGVSRNVCDGLQRIATPTGTGVQRVRVDLWPTAHRFRRGHRLRVQVSSGAFPRWARNLGTAEPLATGTEARAAEQTIHLGPDHPSALHLPVCGRPDFGGQALESAIPTK